MPKYVTSTAKWGNCGTHSAGNSTEKWVPPK